MSSPEIVNLGEFFSHKYSRRAHRAEKEALNPHICTYNVALGRKQNSGYSIFLQIQHIADGRLVGRPVKSPVYI